MTLARLSLASSIESRVANTAKDARLVNALIETKSGVKQIVKRPGTQELNISPAMATAQGQGLFFWNNYLIAGVDNNVYLISGQTTSSVLGSVVGDLVPFSFTSVANDVKLAFHNGSNLYTINKGTPPTFVGGVGLTGVVNSVNINTPGGYYGYDTSCTISVGATTTVTKTGHGLVAGQGVQFNGTLPTGMVAGTTYQVVYVDANSFTINDVTSAGGIGTAITTSGTSSGVTYQASPTVTFGTSPGTTAKGTALLYNHQVSEVVLTVLGAGYTSTPTVTFSGPIAGVAGTVTVGTGFTSTTVSGYSILNSTGAIASVVTTSYTPGFASVTLATAGSGYLTAPTWSFTATLGSHIQTLPAPTTATATGTAVMASGSIQGPFAAGLAYLNGKCYVMDKLGNVYDSNTDDPSIWPGTYLNASSDPDGGVALIRHLNYLLAFGQWSTECLYDAGNPTGSPLAVNQSAKLEIGCAAGYSVAKAEQTVLWVGQGLTEGRGVFLMDGMSPVRVSTRYIEKYLNADDMSKVKAYCMKLPGHTLYVLTLESSNITLVYDLDEKEWYQWSSMNAIMPQEDYFSPTFFNGNIEYQSALYALGDDNGKIYKLDSSYTSDSYNQTFQLVIPLRIVIPITDSGTTKRKFYRRVELVGDKVIGNAYIRHTDDDFITWSTYRTIPLNNERAQAFQLGSGRRRAWEILITDNIPVRLDALEVDFDIGRMEGAQG